MKRFPCGLAFSLVSSVVVTLLGKFWMNLAAMMHYLLVPLAVLFSTAMVAETIVVLAVSLVSAIQKLTNWP